MSFRCKPFDSIFSKHHVAFGGSAMDALNSKIGFGSPEIEMINQVPASIAVHRFVAYHLECQLFTRAIHVVFLERAFDQ